MEKMLITKLVRTDADKADLYGRGHRFTDIKVFDLSDIAPAVPDYADLPIGEAVPCRFWAHYELSEKLNQAGNPYKDLVQVEPLEPPVAAAADDSREIMEELAILRGMIVEMEEAFTTALVNATRAMADYVAALEHVRGTGKPIPVSVVANADAAPESGNGEGEQDELDDFFPRDDMRPAEFKRVVPAGVHRGQSLGYLAEHDPAYLLKISESAKSQKLKDAAAVVLDWSRQQAESAPVA